MTQPTQQQLEHLFDQGLTLNDLARMYQVRVDQIKELLEDRDVKPVTPVELS